MISLGHQFAISGKNFGCKNHSISGLLRLFFAGVEVPLWETIANFVSDHDWIVDFGLTDAKVRLLP